MPGTLFVNGERVENNFYKYLQKSHTHKSTNQQKYSFQFLILIDIDNISKRFDQVFLAI